MSLAAHLKTTKAVQKTLWEAPEPVEVPQPAQEEKAMADPRPDLEEDSELWTRFLLLAELFHSSQLAGILHGFRCAGTRIKRGRKGYVLRPDIDPSGKTAWKSREDYERDRDKWLKPHVEKIAELLQCL